MATFSETTVNFLDVTIRETLNQHNKLDIKTYQNEKILMNTLISSIDTGEEGLETDHVSVL